MGTHGRLPALVRFVILAVALGAALPAAAAGFYKTVGPDGTVTYSDTPKPPAAETPPPAAPAAPVHPPAAKPETPARTTTADEVLELSGVRPQLASTPRKLAGEFRPSQGRLNAEDTAALEQILARHFDAERLYTQIRGEFRRRADARKLADVGEWLRSPLGQKITALEVAAGLEPDAGQRMIAYAPGGRGGPPPSRVALVERIDWVAGVTDGALESMLAVARALGMAVNRALPPDERQTSAQLERQVQQLRGRARAKLARSTTMFMLYQYRALDEDELLQYADFLASDAGRWYSATMSKAMNRTVAVAAQRAANEVIRAIPPQRWSVGASASPQH